MFIYLSFLFLSFAGFLINGMYQSRDMVSYYLSANRNQGNKYITLSFQISDTKHESKPILYNCFEKYFEHPNLNCITQQTILKHQIDLPSENSKTILNLLFEPLSIDPKNNDFLDVFKSTNNKIEEEETKKTILSTMHALHNHFQIDENITKIMEHIITNPLLNNYQVLLKEYLNNKKISYDYHEKKTCNNIIDICLEYIRNNNDISQDQNTINFSYLKGPYPDDFGKIYTNLMKNKLVPEQENVKTIRLSISPLEGKWLKNLRMTFPNLKTIECTSDGINLKIDQNYDGFYYLVYNNNNDFNPLTICVKNSQQAKQKVRKKLLIWYKYTSLVPLLLMYTLLQSIGFCCQNIPILFNDTTYTGYMIVRLLSSTTPMVSILRGFCNASAPGGYLKKNHTWLGVNLKSDYKVNKSDLIVIIPILFTLCGLLSDSMIMNISLKKFLCTQTCITLCLTAIMYSKDNFKTEYAVYHILNNMNAILMN